MAKLAMYINMIKKTPHRRTHMGIGSLERTFRDLHAGYTGLAYTMSWLKASKAKIDDIPEKMKQVQRTCRYESKVGKIVR